MSPQLLNILFLFNIKMFCYLVAGLLPTIIAEEPIFFASLKQYYILLKYPPEVFQSLPITIYFIPVSKLQPDSTWRHAKRAKDLKQHRIQ